MRNATVGLLAAALIAGPVGAQETPRGMIRGYVMGTGPDDLLGGAVVYVKDSPHTTVANSSGYYELEVPEGLWIVSVFHARGADLAPQGAPSSLVVVQANDTADADFTFRSADPGARANPYVLEGLEIFVERTRVAANRREGARIDAMELDEIVELETSARHVGDLVRVEFPTLRVTEWDSNTLCIESRRGQTINPRAGGRCPYNVAVMLDGVLVVEPESYLPGLPPSTIARIEYVPPLVAGARFGTNASNGVLLIWTR